MIVKRTAALSLLLLACLGSRAQQKAIYHKGWIDFNKNSKMDVFEDPKATVDNRVADLLSQMNIDEKTCQMATLYGYGRVLKDSLPTPQWKNEIWKDGIANIDEHLNNVARNAKAKTSLAYPYSRHAESINTVQRWFVEETRMGIPVDFTNEGIHGLNHERATALPAPIAIGSTWNKALVKQAGIIVGREAKALGYTNVYAPILDPARDPRWGRVVECYGEDPYLIAQLGINMVNGIQSQGVASTLKHFAAYSVPKGGRDGNVRTDPHIAPRELHQLYLYPFEQVIKQAHPMGVMSSYNDWDGEPVTGSYYFLTKLLRQQYGFTGYVVSDSEAVEYLYTKHHVADSYKDAVRQVIEAGLNVRTNFTPAEDYILPLRELVKEGKVSMAVLDSRVADVLRVKFQLGLFDEPYVKDPKVADKIVNPANTNAFAMDMARESLVLLKNEKNFLPLNRAATKRILVTGPMATETEYAVSRYGPSNLPVISVLKGIQDNAGKAISVTYKKGCDVIDAAWPESEIMNIPLTADENASIAEAVAAAKDVDVIVAVLGEDQKRVGEGYSRSGLDLPGRQEQLLEALKATGKQVVLVMINGRPQTVNWANKYVDGIIEAWFTNQFGGKAIAEVLFGDYNPGGKLPVTFPKSTGQIEFNFPFKPASQTDQKPEGNFNRQNTTLVNGPLYPFGYGLSYTTFSYSNLTVTPQVQGVNGDIEVSVNVTNTGQRKGDEIVQLYLKDKVSSVTTYEAQLRGFERVPLNPGETKIVKFTLHADDLALLDKNMNKVVEPGEFEVWIGASSTDIKLKQGFVIK